MVKFLTINALLVCCRVCQ